MCGVLGLKRTLVPAYHWRNIHSSLPTISSQETRMRLRVCNTSGHPFLKSYLHQAVQSSTTNIASAKSSKSPGRISKSTSVSSPRLTSPALKLQLLAASSNGQIKLTDALCWSLSKQEITRRTQGMLQGCSRSPLEKKSYIFYFPVGIPSSRPIKMEKHEREPQLSLPGGWKHIKRMEGICRLPLLPTYLFHQARPAPPLPEFTVPTLASLFHRTRM